MYRCDDCTRIISYFQRIGYSFKKKIDMAIVQRIHKLFRVCITLVVEIKKTLECKLVNIFLSTSFKTCVKWALKKKRQNKDINDKW